MTESKCIHRQAILYKPVSYMRADTRYDAPRENGGGFSIVFFIQRYCWFMVAYNRR
jgi:hypothetical protein